MTRLQCRRVALRNLGLLVLTLVVAGQVHANEILGIRWNESPHNTRIVLDLSEPADYKYGQLDNPTRVYIDLKNTSPKGTIRVRDIDSRVLKSIRHAVGSNGMYRVVLDLTRKVEPKVFKLDPYNPYGHRLVIDLPSEVKLDDCSTNNEPHKDVVVVVDAGHGGEDPGAIAITGIFEKHVTLAIARIVQEVLEDAPGFRVVMTRDGDYEVPLNTRRNIAMMERAHVFVSVHADSVNRPGPKGGSVFVLDNGKAVSELNKWHVQNENRSDWVGGVASWVNSECFDEPNQYRFLNEMPRDFVLDSSVAIGKSVLQEMSSVAGLHPRALTKNRRDFRVTDAGYFVLKSTHVPSILVETGYLSNPTEARLLETSSHQRAVGEAIAFGVLSYFCDNPPWHTDLSRGEVECPYNRTIKTYRVKSGDTLGEIALANNVSVSSLLQMNNLNSDRIYTDQLLTIPIRPRRN